MSAQGPVRSKSSTYVATRRQVACAVGGEAVILHLDDGIYYSLNAVGARVWALLQEPRTAEELVTHVVDEFDVGSDRCRADVEDLLLALKARSLVVAAEGPT
jgi:Coenzyme PQQ synthesis protein D (PqqD)